MAILMEVFPAPNGPRTITVNGRSYAGTPGTYQTVPLQDGQILISNGWMAKCQRGSGSTADRPAQGAIDVQAGMPGTSYFDTTVGALITWDGVNWRNILTGSVA